MKAKPSRLVAIIPQRRFATAKSRLPAAVRADAAREMFEHVLAVVSASVGEVVVATDGEDVTALASARGARVLMDEPGAPLAAIIERALASVSIAGAGGGAAIVVMADLPRLRRTDIARMVKAIDGADVVVAPDREDVGTNAIAMRFPAPVRMQFGGGASFERHLRAAAGLRVAVVRSAGWGFDVDQVADLDAWRRSGTRSGLNEKRGSRVSAS